MTHLHSSIAGMSSRCLTSLDPSGYSMGPNDTVKNKTCLNNIIPKFALNYLFVYDTIFFNVKC